MISSPVISCFLCALCFFLLYSQDRSQREYEGCRHDWKKTHTIVTKCLSHDKWLTGDRLIKIGPVSLSLQPPQSTFSFCAHLSECSCSVLAPCQSISGKGADCICLMSSRQRESVFQQPRHTDRKLEDHFVCAHYAQRLTTAILKAEGTALLLLLKLIQKLKSADI